MVHHEITISSSQLDVDVTYSSHVVLDGLFGFKVVQAAKMVSKAKHSFKIVGHALDVSARALAQSTVVITRIA